MKKHTIALVSIVALVVIGGAAYFAPRWSTPAAGDSRSSEGSSTAKASAAPPAANQGGQAKGVDAKGPAKGPAGGPPPVEVVELKPTRVQEDLPAVGSLRSNESVVIRPEVSGRIAQIGFRDGQPVSRGQLLIALDASVNEAEVAQARAELELSQSNLKRTEDLARKNFVSDSAQDQAASNVRVLEARLKLAQARLAKMRIAAPFDGVVGIRSVSVGDYVKEGADLVNIEDVRTLKADFRLPERLFKQLKVGLPVEIVADALPDETYAGTIEAMNPRVDANGRSLELRARMANPGQRLKPGMFARVRVIVGSRADALLVPEEAVVPLGAEFFVFRVVDGKAERMPVKLGIRRNAQVELLEGVSAGDRIVVSGQLRLARDGMPVRVMGAEPGAAPSGAAAPEKTPVKSPQGAATKG